MPLVFFCMLGGGGVQLLQGGPRDSGVSMCRLPACCVGTCVSKKAQELVAGVSFCGLEDTIF